MKSWSCYVCLFSSLWGRLLRLYRHSYRGGLPGGEPAVPKPVGPSTPAQLTLRAAGGQRQHTHTHK